MASIAIRQQFYAPIDEVFAVVAAHEMLEKVFPLVTVDVVKASENASNGLDSVRALGIGWLKPVKEQVTVYEPPKRIEYKMVGMATKLIPHHYGVITFSEDGTDGKSTLVIWHITERTLLPPVSRMMLPLFKRAIGKKLAREAKRLRKT